MQVQTKRQKSQFNIQRVQVDCINQRPLASRGTRLCLLAVVVFFAVITFTACRGFAAPPPPAAYAGDSPATPIATATATATGRCWPQHGVGGRNLCRNGHKLLQVSCWGHPRLAYAARGRVCPQAILPRCCDKYATLTSIWNTRPEKARLPGAGSFSQGTAYPWDLSRLWGLRAPHRFRS